MASAATILATIERGLAVLDRLASYFISILAVVVGTMGLLMGMLSYPGKGSLGGHEFTLALAATLYACGWLFAVAGRWMREGAAGRWVLQIAPVVAWVVGFTFTLCISGTMVILYGETAICRPQ